MSGVEAVWPGGVLARYLTVGGATVDISTEHPSDEEPYTIATCQGCTWFDISSWDDANGYLRLTEAADGAFGSAKKAAQGHAEICRAMPKPGGAQ